MNGSLYKEITIFLTFLLTGCIFSCPTESGAARKGIAEHTVYKHGLLELSVRFSLLQLNQSV